LFRDTLNLTAAFPFTGAGLATFPGLYSQYIERIPFPFFYYGHNLYLDLLLEQGPLGLLTFVGLWVGAGYYLWASERQRDPQERKRIRGLSLLRWAAFSSIVIVALHGLVDDALYSERGLPVLFLPLGMALATSYATSKQRPFLPQMNLALIAVIVVGIGLVIFRPVRAAWYENLAAVQMAQIELANWPSGRWFDTSYAASLDSPKVLLETAVALNPGNFSAQYRLGQIALIDGDFETAVKHLEIAFQHNRNHRGVQKALAYSYTWAGQLDKAFPLFAHAPGSARELATYAEWWRKEDREDLAVFAVQMGERLNAANTAFTNK
jgi:tetratricopeptide (TPR) repeat protein